MLVLFRGVGRLRGVGPGILGGFKKSIGGDRFSTVVAVKLKNLTPTQVRCLYCSKLDTGLAPRTVQYIHTTLRKALQDALSDGLMPRNVAAVREGSEARKERDHATVPRAGTSVPRYCQRSLRQVRGTLRRGHTFRAAGRR